MNRYIFYCAFVIFAFVDKLPPTLAELAEAHHIFWDSNRRIPIAILSKNFYLEPCSAEKESHRRLFQEVFTDSDTMRYWADGRVRHMEEVLPALKRFASPWKNFHLTGAFVVMQNDQAIMLIGVGLFQAAGVGEFYIIAHPSIRGKGMTGEVMGVLKKWCVFLRESNVPAFINYVNGKKAVLSTVFATASEENIASIRMLLKSGFRPLKSFERYRMGFPKAATMFPAPSDIQGLDSGYLSMIYPTRYIKRKAGFELHVRNIVR
jgi:RimJ/RimL family protein N-acetyltransferase